PERDGELLRLERRVVRDRDEVVTTEVERGPPEDALDPARIVGIHARRGAEHAVVALAGPVVDRLAPALVHGPPPTNFADVECKGTGRGGQQTQHGHQRKKHLYGAANGRMHRRSIICGAFSRYWPVVQSLSEKGSNIRPPTQPTGMASARGQAAMRAQLRDTRKSCLSTSTRWTAFTRSWTSSRRCAASRRWSRPTPVRDACSTPSARSLPCCSAWTARTSSASSPTRRARSSARGSRTARRRSPSERACRSTPTPSPARCSRPARRSGWTTTRASPASWP